MEKFNSVLKRLYDLAFAVVFILLTGWVMIISAICIKCSSKGPILYKAKRMGFNCEEFTIYKFRSMVVDSGEIKITTLENDDRIYPFGRFMRATKVDELPQLFNILFGSMSVVGPRPEDVDIANEFIGEFKEIYKVKPGLTSIASIYDYTHGEIYEDEDLYIKEFMPEKLALEKYYAEHSNIFYDIKLTAWTSVIIVKKVFGKKKIEKPMECNYIEPVKMIDEAVEVE